MSQYDSREHEIYSQAKDAEAQRKKQAQTVEAMYHELESLKQTNAKRLKVCVHVCDSTTASVDTDYQFQN